MSTLPHEPVAPGGAREGQIQLLARLLATLAAIASLVALWAGERVRLDRDLQLMAEAVASPGENLAVRALVLEQLDAAQGPALVLTPVHVRLLDREGRVLARQTLEPKSASESMEGQLRVPATLRGWAALDASAKLPDGEVLSCRRALRVEAEAAELPALPRSAGPLQTLSVGAAHAVADASAPEPFLPRIPGGACLPEARCTLLVWVGEPASSVLARESPQVSVAGPAVPAGETTGLVSIDVIPHGLEAHVTLEAWRGGVRVAERTLRLPLGLGEVGVSVRTPLLDPERPLSLFLTLPPGRKHAIVDVFAQGRWRASETAPDISSEGPIELRPERIPAADLVRIQARVDRFSSDGAGTRVVYRRAHGVGTDAALRELSARVHASEYLPETAAWTHALPSFAESDPQRTAAYLLAPLETLRVPVPAAFSGRPQALARLGQKKALLRFGVAGVLILCALVVTTSLLRRGLFAADQARAILDEAQEAGGGSSAEKGYAGRLGVILLVLAVALAFLAGALLIVAKPLWF